MSEPEPKPYTMVKRAGVLCLIGVCVWGSAELALLLRLYRQQSVSVLRNVDSVTQELQSSARAFKTVSELQAEQLTDPRTQRSIGLLLRVGDDLSRTVMKVNNALDKTNQALQTVNTETLPRVNQCLDGSRALILKCDDGITLILSDTDATIKEIRALLAKPEVNQFLNSVASIAQRADGVAENIHVSSSEVRNALPALVESLKMVAANTDTTTAEVAKFLKRLNTPLSKKEKAMAVLLRVIAATGPSITELLRR